MEVQPGGGATLFFGSTAIGTQHSGEGVFGLRRAFQVGGARTLIMSLWPVEDDSSRDWMSKLYENRFREGLDTAEAIQRASLEMLTARRLQNLSTHPFFRAGFVAAGDWN